MEAETEAPPVDGEGVTLIEKELWGKVFVGAAEGVGAVEVRGRWREGGDRVGGCRSSGRGRARRRREGRQRRIAVTDRWGREGVGSIVGQLQRNAVICLA